MIWFLAGLAVLACILLLLYAFAYGDPGDIRRVGLWVLALIGVAVIVVLLLSGRAGLIWLAFGFFLPLLRRATMAGRLFRFWRQYRGAGGGKHAGRPGSGKMSRAEALEILGLGEGADRKEIISAHRRLMKQAHPDKGGTTRMAALLNEARDVLLG